MTSYVDPTAIIRDGCRMGERVEIREFVVVGAQPFLVRKFKRVEPDYGVVVRDDVFINAYSSVVSGTEGDTVIRDKVNIAQRCIIGHDALIDEKVILMNNVILNGHVEVGRLTKIMTGARVRERVKIGSKTIIGMGSNVVSDIPDNVVAYGNPCKVVRENPYGVRGFVREHIL
jgi:acyl-[acyl carrier protein]--UDP-N-acetylglucosamine O-acyltransferase